MDDHLDETVHVIISLGKFENNKKEIIAAICAMLNSNGGKVVIHVETDSNDIPVEGSASSQMSPVIRILEQSMISIIGVPETISKISFINDDESIVISVENTDYLITTNYNLYLPSQTQVNHLSPMERTEKVKDILNRKIVPQPVQLGSHCQMFRKDNECSFQESKVVQFKWLKASSSKSTTLADRMTGKGNKFSSYVSAFANHCGGHIYYGITDVHRIVEGEFIPNEKDKNEITKKVGKAINKMIWPRHIGQPKRGKHWEIFFEPVLDENSKRIPSTFVIVIYIAPCLGGVFIEEPECYEMVKGKVVKTSFMTWKERLLHRVWLRSKDEIPPSVQCITWTSDKARKAFTFGSHRLRQLINNGNWNAILGECQILEKKSHLHETKLAVLSKTITACYRRGNFKKACNLLYKYETIFWKVQNIFIFEVVGLYLHAALERASGDFWELEELLTAALSKAELIEPGLVTATVYLFAATVSDLISSRFKVPRMKFSPDVLSIKALEHIRCVHDFPSVVASMEQKAHMTLATFYLGCNISGQLIKANVDASRIDKAKSSIMAVHEGNPLSKYRDVQLNLVLSIYNYRHSQQVSPDQRIRFLRSAFSYAKKAENLARDYQFMEMVEWSKANEALCTEELVRAKFAVLPKS